MQNGLKIYILLQFFNFVVCLKGKCEAGLHCKQREECPAFQEHQANLESLTRLTPAWYDQLSKLDEMKCDGVENGVCCKSFNKPSKMDFGKPSKDFYRIIWEFFPNVI